MDAESKVTRDQIALRIRKIANSMEDVISKIGQTRNVPTAEKCIRENVGSNLVAQKTQI